MALELFIVLLSTTFLVGLNQFRLKIPNQYSFITLIFIVIVVVGISFINLSVDIIRWDVFGYYLYLPALFIHNDIGIQNGWIQDVLTLYHNTDTLYQLGPSLLGQNVDQYSMGMAFLYLPFFFLGHIFALLSDYPVDGFSLPYQVAIFSSGLFYFAIGLIYLRKVLLHIFSEKVAALTLLILAFGTNYFHIEVYSRAMSHNYLFALYAILIWRTIKWHQQQTFRNSIFLGIIIGLLTVTRPTEIISVLIPLLYGVTSIQGFKERVSFLIKKKKEVFIVAITTFLIGFPQLVYWKLLTGNFIYYSYTNPGEGLDLLSPHLLDVLLSFRKGWLVYAPLMLFALTGIYFLFKKHKNWGLPIMVFTFLNFYLVASWSTWWYADSFGQRALMQSYAVLAIPLAAFIQQLFKFKKSVKYSFVGLIGLFVVLNLFQTWQYSKGIIDSSRMTRAAYFSVFGQSSPTTEEQKKLLSIFRGTTGVEMFDNQNDYELKLTEELDFENENLAIPYEGAHSGQKVFKMDSINRFSSGVHKSFNELTSADHAWIKVSLWIYPTDKWQESKLSLITTFTHKNKAYKYRGLDIETLSDIKPNEWQKLEMVYLTPEPRSKADEFSTYAWLRGDEGIIIDDLKMEVFVKKED